MIPRGKPANLNLIPENQMYNLLVISRLPLW